LLESHPGLSARDAVHLAVMKAHEIVEVFSFDAGFDAVPTVKRIVG
jgi:predicted nucleic acid-binding protein